MRAQDFIADETMRAADGLIHQATKMGDKASWSPLDEGRTALDQVAECALICSSMVDVLKNWKMPEFTPEMMKEYEKSKAALSLDEAVAMLKEKTSALCDVIRAVPDEELVGTMQFWGPEPWSKVGVMNYHNWNMTYHNGQLNYIQTLYGDKSMG
ncbi:MAG: hypothetical protein KF824_08575 [Fimbriimonadaceae bacterium]|nr:MAG: hypothetical protein KF824_08575 [Fimbriimonadaceae bacterium]